MLQPTFVTVLVKRWTTWSMHLLKIKPAFRAVIFLLLATATPAMSAPLIEEQQALDFGTIAIGSNTSVSRYTYPGTGTNVIVEGQIILIAAGLPGLYVFTDFPALTTLTISIDETSLTTGTTGIPEPLNVDNFDSTELTTDADGRAELSLGARLNTTGNAGVYIDASYSATTVLRVDYWQPDEGSFNSEAKVIELQTQLRSALTIDEEQPLNFGILFARSSASDQASITLSPADSYSIIEPGETRLVSLADPKSGILRVTGAAPIYDLIITAQTANVLLEHTESPDTSPHFILSDLITSPSVTGTTNSDGELLIQTGGTLKTEITASPMIYPSGQYRGSYELVISY